MRSIRFPTRHGRLRFARELADSDGQWESLFGVAFQFQADTKGSSEYVALVSGFGVAGLQLTLIGGIILDRCGRKRRRC
jgi:hypothetical protein